MLNDFVKSFEKIFDKFRKEIKQEYSFFAQEVTSKKAEENNIYYRMKKDEDNNIKISQFEMEKTKLKEKILEDEKRKALKEQVRENIIDTKKRNFAIGLIDSQNLADGVTEELKSDTKELEKIYTNAIEKMIKGTEDFSSITKTLMQDLIDYFVKAAAEAVANGIIDSTIGQSINSALSGVSSLAKGNLNSGNFICSLIGSIASLFGSHHSGGFIAQGTGTLPGTSEYLSILKGGERVLSPSENAAYQSNNNGQNVVVNNFNVQAWNSKDVQKYLLENKNLIGKITAENIKYNNSNLRYMMGG